MTNSTAGNWTFVAIAVLYALSVTALAVGRASLRDSSAACVFTSAWLTVWAAFYATWWAVACAAGSIVFFGWLWYRADDSEDDT